MSFSRYRISTRGHCKDRPVGEGSSSAACGAEFKSQPVAYSPPRTPGLPLSTEEGINTTAPHPPASLALAKEKHNKNVHKRHVTEPGSRGEARRAGFE